jgi:hypothetical protein
MNEADRIKFYETAYSFLDKNASPAARPVSALMTAIAAVGYATAMRLRIR